MQGARQEELGWGALWSRGGISFSFLCVVLSVCVPVAAQSNGSGEHAPQNTLDEPSVEDVKAAAAAFDAGRAAFKSADYAVAAENFERADALVANPKVLQLAVQSRDLAGHSARAATLAALARQRYPADERFADADELASRAATELHKLEIECEQPCSILLGIRLVPGRPATERTVFVPAGEHRVRAVFESGEGETHDYSAEVGRSGSLRFAVKPPEPEPPATAPAPERPPKPAPVQAQAIAPATQSAGTSGLPPVVFWTGVAASGILVGVSTWSAIDTWNNPGRQGIARRCEPSEGTQCATYQQALERQSRTNVLWGVTAGVGALTALVGGIWTNWGGAVEAQNGSNRAATATKLRIDPWIVVGDGATIGARGRF